MIIASSGIHMKISIAQSFKLFGIIIIAGLAITTAASYFSLYKLKIGSTAYENIIASKDLVSDILPPPAYIIEAYLEVNLARDQADKLDFHISKLASLQADYIERRDHWAQATGLPDDLRDELTKTSDEQVQKFWKETTTQFIPALKSKNTAAAEASMALLGTIYEKHRAIINGVVVKANAFSAAAEQAAGAQAFIFQILMFGTAALVILLTIVSLRLMRIKASDPLAVLADYMGELADEKYETEVPLRGNTDEIGHMARSVDVFRAAILERRRNRLEQSETDLRNQRERRSADEAVQFERETALAAIAAGLTAISNKNLTYRVETQMPPAFSKLQTDFNSAISALEVAMDDVVLGISAIGAGTNQISSAAEGLSVQTEHQAATLEETAAALAQVSKMVNATAEGIPDDQQIANETGSLTLFHLSTLGIAMTKLKLGLVGVGKIAIDQHIPSIAETDLFDLVAVVSQRGVEIPGAETFKSQTEMLAAMPELTAIANCTPPSVRHAATIEALQAGRHVLIEKPPTSSVAELADMVSTATQAKRTLFATWHSQFNAAVDQAAQILQEWIWQAGGFGVFDPGINALSILVKIMPVPVFIQKADLLFPQNRDTPIAATLAMMGPATSGLTVTADFDWRQEGEQTWSIDIALQDGGTMQLTHGGTRLFIDGEAKILEKDAEYLILMRAPCTLSRILC
eukprot:gene13180-13287_t